MPLPVSNDPVTDQGRLYVSPSLPAGDGGLPIAPVADPDAATMANVPTDNNANVPNVATRVINKLLGTGGEERYKTWPEKLLRDALSAPHDVLNSTMPSTSGDLIKPALDMSALAGTGGLGGVGEGAGAALGSSPFLRPALKYEGKIYKAPMGGEHMDAIPETLRPEFTKQAMSGEDISNFNFGFMNHKGQFLDREKALKYAIDEGLLSPHDAKYGALTSTMDFAPKIETPKVVQTSSGYQAIDSKGNSSRIFSDEVKAEEWADKNKIEIKPRNYLDSKDVTSTLMADSGKEAAALDASKKAGFNIDSYHGSPFPFEGNTIKNLAQRMHPEDAADEIAAGRLDPNKYEFYSTENRKLANSYAENSWITNNGVANITPLKLNTKDYKIIDAQGKNYKDSHSEIEKARKEGYKGITIKNSEDNPMPNSKVEPSTVHVSFDPSTVRSKFAKFDVKRIKENNLLASRSLPIKDDDK